jgi:DNA modification methylase
VLHCVEKVEPVAYVGEVWNLTVEGNPTFQTEIGMSHNTVKPVDLMRWLVRLVTPPRGIVLDPFMGSGSTGVACRLEGVGFVGIDQEPRYVEIARLRCARE